MTPSTAPRARPARRAAALALLSAVLLAGCNESPEEPVYPLPSPSSQVPSPSPTAT